MVIDTEGCVNRVDFAQLSLPPACFLCGQPLIEFPAFLDRISISVIPHVIRISWCELSDLFHLSILSVKGNHMHLERK